MRKESAVRQREKFRLLKKVSIPFILKRSVKGQIFYTGTVHKLTESKSNPKYMVSKLTESKFVHPGNSAYLGGVLPH